jgi:hypothetical protein
MEQALSRGPLSGLIGGRGAASAAGGVTRSLLGSDIVRAILVWQVLGQIAGPLLAPLSAEIQQQVFEKFPDLPMQVADAVDAVIRGHMSEAEGREEVKKSGVGETVYGRLLDNAGEPPAPQTLLEMWRREVIPESGGGAGSTSLEQGIREGRTKNKWIEPLKALRYQLPSPEAALQALLQGQTDEATARDLYARWGGQPDFFQLLFDTQGSAPSPLEAADMARRGIIPWQGRGPDVVSFEQAFLEGPWRNKWMGSYEAAAVYRPPVRTIVAMLRNGSIDDAQALTWLKDVGADQATAAAMLTDAHHQRNATERNLAKGDVLALYLDEIIPGPQATAMLADLGYSGAEAAWLLALQDFHRQKALTDAAVSRLRSLYINRKQDKATVSGELDQLGIAAAQRDNLLRVWELERNASVRTLTPAELTAGVFYGAITEAEALASLEALGYSPLDAWIVLADRLHAAPSTPKPSGSLPPPYLA